MTDEADLVEAWLENQRMERLKDYFQRGRKLADLPLEDLHSRWMALVEDWADNTSAFAGRHEEEDIRSELAARRLEPPWESVRGALNKIKAKARETSIEISQDPEKAKQVERELLEDIKKFRAEIDRMKS